MNKEIKKQQKVARRKKLAKQHQQTDKELKKHVMKDAVSRRSDMMLRRIKKNPFDGVVDDTTQPQSARVKKQ